MLKSNVIDGQLYLLIEGFLSERIQRVVLNCKMFSWELVLAGVPRVLSFNHSFF